MSAAIRQIKTAAEQGLSDAFAAAKAKLPGKGAIASMRAAAFDVFEAKGLPHRRVEEWKYTDLRALMRDAKPLAPPPDAAAKAKAAKAGAILAGIKARRIVLVDGTFAAELSDLAKLDKGLRIGSLAQALAEGDAETLRHVGRVLPMDGDAAVALNTAFMGDGAVIHIDDGAALERSIHLVFVTTGTKATSSFTRSLIIAGRGARAMIVESHEGPDGVDYQVNTALEFAVGEKSEIDHIKIVAEGDKALHLSTLMAAIGGQAKLNEFSFVAGGAVVRNQLSLRFDGEGTNADVRGASLLRGKQHADTTLVADHVKGHCNGREFFRAVLDGESQSVFQGKIIVRPNAQKTDSKMMSNALLLSDNAEADHKPELEIFADDVVCGHGATAGALDEDLLFYLKARGIPPKEAEALLIEAFAGAAVEGIAHEGIREALMERVRGWLKERG